MEQTESIDWEQVAKQFQLENEAWSAQVKGLQFHQKGHWTVHIRKPEFLLAALSSLVEYLKSVEPYRLYIYTAIVCTILGTVAELIVAARGRGLQ